VEENMSDDKAPDQTRIMPDAREARFPKYRLVVIEGPDTGKQVEGGSEEIAVGTADANDLIVGDPSVSRHHFVLAPRAKGPLVRDLGSTNGTALNGVMIERAYLSPGAVIAIGSTKLRFEPGGEDERAALSKESRWGRALGSSEAMRRIFAVLPKLADSDATILLEGETGTGKGLIASAIHEASPRKAGPFIVIDCGSIPPNLIESELFGHEKGSFTGATGQRLGAFESARGGTIFLDEIGELPLDMQPKLLRALEEKLVKRIGGNEQIKLDIRVIAATNRDLRAEINRGRFRSDVYYRLNTFRLRLPPLRERREDIALLVAHFYEQLSRGDTEPPAELIAGLMKQDWPGNVRELRAAVERSVLLGDLNVWREISEETPSPQPTRTDGTIDESISFRAAKEKAVAEWERVYVRSLIDQHGGNLSRAARAVRMDRNHLRELLVRHRIRVDDA
jgi:two-component system, NtrC family, response regulator GlrR